MSFDPHVPTELKDRLVWFASIITRPIDLHSQMMPISPSGISMEVEAARYIAPSPTLRPHQRIQLYNQQYWWRLLSGLHEIFPLVTRLFGYTDFNQTIGIPYLERYPPDTWSLNNIGDKLPRWIKEYYLENDQKLVWESALLDQTFNECFLIEGKIPINGEHQSPETVEALMNQTLFLQPHVRLFELDNDLFTFREEMIKQDPDYWIEHDFPPLLRERSYYYVIARTVQNHLLWKEISKAEYALLQVFEKGSTMDNACEWLEKQPKEIREESEQQLASWLQDWTVRRWLTLESLS